MIHDGSLVLRIHGFYFKYIYLVFAVSAAAVGCMSKMISNSEFRLRIIWKRHEWKYEIVLHSPQKHTFCRFYFLDMLKTSTSESQAKPFFRTKSSSSGNVQIFCCSFFFFLSVRFLFHCRYSLQRTDHIISHEMFCQ